MRVVTVEPGPNFSVEDVHRGWRSALEGLGVQVCNFNLAARLQFYTGAMHYNAEHELVAAFDDMKGPLDLINMGLLAYVFEVWPDVVIVTSGFFVLGRTLDVIRSRGIRVVLLCTESPYEDDVQLKRARHSDVVLVNDPTNLDRFADAALSGVAAYAPHAYNPAVHHPGPARAEMVCDFTFVGTAYPSRVALLEQAGLDGLDVVLAGNWISLPDDHRFVDWVGHPINECLDNSDTADLYRSAATSANIYRTGLEAQRPELGDGWAMGPREIELAASGCWFARDPRPESDETFPMLPTFDEPAELGELVRWALANPAKRQAAADKARAAIADRTFENNARQLLRLLDGLGIAA